MSVVVIDYGAGNLRSAAKAFEVAGVRVTITSDPDLVARADALVLPGDGAFPDCRRGLARVRGLDQAMHEAVHLKGRPFLGICVGMQLLADEGLEHERTKGLGWISGLIRPITVTDPRLKVPHMGWNTLRPHRPHPLLEGIALGDNGLHAYFLHAYHMTPTHPEDVLADAEYGGAVTAMIAKDNVVGTQFHPEKSQKLGLALVANFLKWRP